MPTLSNINGRSLGANTFRSLVAGQAAKENRLNSQQNRRVSETGLENEQALMDARGRVFNGGLGTGNIDYEAMQEVLRLDPTAANRMYQAAGANDEYRQNDMQQRAGLLLSLPYGEQRDAEFARQIAGIEARGGDAQQTRTASDMDQSGQEGWLGVYRGDSIGGDSTPADQQYFEYLTEGMSPEQILEAKEVKLRLRQGAVGNALTTMMDSGRLPGYFAARQSEAEHTSFGSGTGSGRSATVTAGAEKIKTIDAGMMNIDRALFLLEKEGAKTGVISQFVPSIQAASIALKEVRNTMALDVAAAAEMKPLSDDDVRLAQSIALPMAMNPKDMITHLKRRKRAQILLRDYFYEQIQYIDQGGTVPGFLREKRGENRAKEQAAKGLADQQSRGKAIIYENEDGSRAKVYADGSYEEL